MEEEWTEQERQLLQILRDWTGTDQYKIIIEVRDGAREIAITGTLEVEGKRGLEAVAARGVGKTFNEAWDNMDPTWA